MTSPAFLHRRSPVFAGRAMASSSSPLVTRVGLRVLEQGGNAVDAAVAMAGMLALAEPMMSGLGGDTMVLVWSAREQKAFGLNGSGRAPSGASLDRIGSVPVMPEHGAATVTIPGAVDGWCALLERFGSRSLQQLWEPVIAYGREGYPVGESIAGFWELGAALLGPSAPTQLGELLLADRSAPQPGQLMRLPQLAATLERVAREGRQGFYEGSVAEAIAATISAGGVPTTLKDVAAQQHRAEWVEPLSVGYRGREVLGMPPNCQGVVALQLTKVAALLVELALQHRQIQLHQHLAARHRLTLLDEQLPHLAAGPGVEDAGVVGVDQHAHAFHLGGHGPEQGPQHQHATHPRQAHAHLVVVTQTVPARLQPLQGAAGRGRCSGGAGLSHGTQFAGLKGPCQAKLLQAPRCRFRLRSPSAQDLGQQGR